MADAMEIIISAVDQASEVFESIISSVSNMADSISDSVGDAGAEFDSMAANVEGFQDAVDNIDNSEIESLADSLGMSTEEVERLIETGSNIGSIPFNDAAAEASELADEISHAKDEMDNLNNSAGDVMVAQTFQEMAEGVTSAMSNMAESAGNFNDSIMRASLEAEGAGVSVEAMKNIVNELSESTGRAGGQIREAFIKATARGVTDMDSFKTMMEGAGAQATLFGTDIESMGNKFSSLAMKDTLMQKTLAETGITMAELGEAMGMTGATADEVKAKWKELDTNQRAAILGTAASMNEGQSANDAYKNSWAGLKEQVDIAKGRLERIAGSVLLPVLIPAMQVAGTVLKGVGDIISSVMNSPLSGLVSVLGTLAGVFAIAVTGAGFLKQMLGFLRIEATLAAIETTALAFAEELQATGSIASAAANAIGATGFAGLATSAWAAAAAVWAAIAPLLPFIAAAALVAVAIYEVGKAFGWWTDVGSMLDAIWAGLQRLWSAFINHPDVQAAIQAITSALQWLWNGIVQAGQAVLDFFGINTGGDFDIVRALIEGIGRAWELVTLPIRVAITVFQAVMGAGNDAGNSLSEAFGGFYNDILVPLGEFLTSVFTPVWNTLVEVFGIVAGAVGQLINAFTQFKNGQMDLPGLIMTVLSTLASMYFSILSTIGNFVLQWAGQLWGYAVNAGRNFLTGIISYVSQLPGRVYSYLLNVLQRVIQMGTLWVTNARNKALQLVIGVVSWLGQLPGKAYSALLGVVSQIVSAGAQWVKAAKEKAEAVVTGAYDTLTGLPGQVASALSGVKDAIVKPFEDAYNKAKEWWDKIKSLGTAAGGEAAGGDVMFAAGGEYSFDNSPVRVENNVNLTLDLKNVPASVDTDTLVSALTNRSVIRELVNNSDFQLLDGKAKERLNLKVNRARGI